MTNTVKDRILALHDQGKTTAEIAAAVERGAGDVRKTLSRAGRHSLEPAGFTTLPLDQLSLDLRNPRFAGGSSRDDPGHEDLKQSIATHGVLEPLLVRRVGGKGRPYLIVAGERRHRAARAAGLAEVPCRILDVDDDQALLIALTENLQRRDMHPLDEGAAFHFLVGHAGKSTADIAQAIGRTRRHVQARMQLVRKLASGTTQAFRAGKITLAQAEALAMNASVEDQKRLMGRLDELRTEQDVHIAIERLQHRDRAAAGEYLAEDWHDPPAEGPVTQSDLDWAEDQVREIVASGESPPNGGGSEHLKGETVEVLADGVPTQADIEDDHPTYQPAQVEAAKRTYEAPPLDQMYRSNANYNHKRLWITGAMHSPKDETPLPSYIELTDLATGETRRYIMADAPPRFHPPLVDLPFNGNRRCPACAGTHWQPIGDIANGTRRWRICETCHPQLHQAWLDAQPRKKAS